MPDSEPNQPQNQPWQDNPETPDLSVRTSGSEGSGSNSSGSVSALRPSDGWGQGNSVLSGLTQAALPGDWPRGKYAATGGAIGAIALGLWALITFWLTDWTIVNAIAGLALGFWGLQSPRPRTAICGLGLNLLALLACLVT